MKIWRIIVVTGFVLAAIIGLIKRQSYSDLMADHSNINLFSVAPLTQNMLKLPMGDYQGMLDQSQIVIRVKAERDREYINRGIRQHVKIMEVYKGSGINNGDEIDLLSTRTTFNFNDMTFNMGFVNLMLKNKEYLVFCDEKVKSPFKGDSKLYRVSDFILNPIFCYEDIENKATNSSERYVPYPQVANDEFIVQDEETLSKVTEVKQILLEKYPK